MGADTLLVDLMARGITLTPEGTSLRVRGQFTDEDRVSIRAHKAELLAALAAKKAAGARTVLAPAHAEVLSPTEAEDRLEHYTERVAIQEHAGGLPREEAEGEARQTVFQGRRAFYFTLTDCPSEAPVVLTSAPTVAAAREELAARFGEGRVIRCWPVGKQGGRQ